MNTQESKSSEHLLCPSYVAKPGASLFGIVQADGKVDYLPEPIQIDKTFVEEAKKGRPAEERFRFAGNCAKGGCHQWDGHECGLVGKIVKALDRVEDGLQACAIRSKCRWFAQEGAKACANCNEIIRNIEAKLVGDSVEGIIA
jgi:hypothetical protein